MGQSGEVRPKTQGSRYFVEDGVRVGTGGEWFEFHVGSPEYTDRRVTRKKGGNRRSRVGEDLKEDEEPGKKGGGSSKSGRRRERRCKRPGGAGTGFVVGEGTVTDGVNIGVGLEKRVCVLPGTLCR